MSLLITRKEIIQSKKIIASELALLQKAYFDNNILQEYKENKEEQLYWDQFDCLGNDVISYSTFYKIISLDHTEIDTFTSKLTEKLKELFQIINASQFIIISHVKVDFFGNMDIKIKPLKKAYKNLEKFVKNKTFNEAFKFETDKLHDFIEILFWTTRCDPSLADYIFLFDKEEQIQIQLCKYGNIHLTEFKRERLKKKKLKELGWTIIRGAEYDNFSIDGKIKGREIKIIKKSK